MQSNSIRPVTALSPDQTQELRAELGVKATRPVFMTFTFSKPFNLRFHDSVFIMIRDGDGKVQTLFDCDKEGMCFFCEFFYCNA